MTSCGRNIGRLIFILKKMLIFLKLFVFYYLFNSRNHKGMYAPRKTRKTCIRQGRISTGNPCPICRDEYLVLDYRNTELLEQFISPHSGDVLSYSKTGLCQKSHLRLRVAVQQARDSGFLTYDVPFREYDYSEYYGQEQKKKDTN